MILAKKYKNPDLSLPLRNIDYEPNRPTALRSIQRCICRICNVARAGGLQYCMTMMKKRGRPSTVETSFPREFFKICGNCMARIYRGSNHNAQVANLLAVQRLKILKRLSKVQHLWKG